jgi:hypothetical protein
MKRVRLFLPLLLGFGLSGCGGVDGEQVSPGNYRITGYLYDANDSTLDHESVRACPAGYSTLTEQHSMVAEGPAWRREIQCKTSN